MYEYVCYTKQGNWRFYADSDIDAMRLYILLLARQRGLYQGGKCNSRLIAFRRFAYEEPLHPPFLQDRQN